MIVQLPITDWENEFTDRIRSKSFWFLVYCAYKVEILLPFCHFKLNGHTIRKWKPKTNQTKNKPNIHDFAFRQGENKNINTWNYGHIQPIQLQLRFNWMHKLFFGLTNINCSSFVFLLHFACGLVCLLCFWCTAHNKKN